MVGIAGKRVLVVEDESLVAMMIDDLLTDRGAVVVGPVGTLEGALELAGGEAVDAALLDVNLNGERSTAVGKALAARGIPYVLATGYIAAECADYAPAAVLQTPYRPAQLLAALGSVLDPG